MSRQHVFELMGGLGNQLFQVAAASKLDPLPVLDISMLRPPFLRHEQGSRSFMKNFEIRDSYAEWGATKWRLLNSSRMCAHRIAGKEFFQKSFVLKDEVFYPGFLDTLGQSRQSIRVRGYFQDLRYLPFSPNTPESLRWQFSLSESSAQFLGRLDPNWCAIHVRLGDFVGLKRSQSLEYFDMSIRHIAESREKHEPLVLFSDDPESAEQLIKPLAQKYCMNLLSAPLERDPEQVMALMSRAGRFILSNSTFSWWAAATSLEAQTVLHPSPSNNHQSRLWPDHWTSL